MKYDWQILVDDLENPRSPKEIASAIARVLEAGTPSPALCRMLAGMIDPSPDARNASPYVLKIRRPKQGGPKGPNWPVAFEMERLVDIEGVTLDVAVSEIQKYFGIKGNSRATCFAALAEARRITQLGVIVDAASTLKSPK